MDDLAALVVRRPVEVFLPQVARLLPGVRLSPSAG
jgi:hypothetical protein